VFTEFRGVRQEPKGHRRWFEAEGIELIVWYGAGNHVAGFQLCYDRDFQQWALTWSPTGFAHDRVLPGDTNPLKDQTPVLEPGGSADWPQLVARFREHSSSLDPQLESFVLTKLLAGLASRRAS
jgi:hypothetical protein